MEQQLQPTVAQCPNVIIFNPRWLCGLSAAEVCDLLNPRTKP